MLEKIDCCLVYVLFVPRMKFLTGDETGILKWVRVEAQKVERFGPQRRGDAVERLCWGGPPSNLEARVAVAHASGAVEMRDGSNGQILGSAAFDANVKSLQALGNGAAAGGLLAVSSSGAAGIVANWCSEEFPAGQATNGAVDSSTAEGGPVVRKFELPGHIADAKVDPLGSDRIVFGGGDNDVKIWDMTKNEVMWRAKNVREDTLCLKVPVKVNVLQWATELAPSRSLILCGTVDGKVRLYDATAQRRPLFELVVGHGAGAGTGGYTGTVDEQARPLLCSAIATVRTNDAWSIFFGNTMGVMREYDLRKLSACISAPFPPGRKAHLNWAAKQMPFRRGYRGIMGSIRACDVHRNGQVMVAVGIGRHAYVFETRKKRMNSKVYLKQKLCSVLMSAEESKTKEAKDDEGEEEEDGERDDITGADGSEDEVQEGFSDDEEVGVGDGGAQDDDDEGDEEEIEDDDDEDDDDDDEAGIKSTTTSAKRQKVAKKVERQTTTVIMPDDAEKSTAKAASEKKPKAKNKNRLQRQKKKNASKASAKVSIGAKKNSKPKKATAKKKKVA